MTSRPTIEPIRRDRSNDSPNRDGKRQRHVKHRDITLRRRRALKRQAN